MDAMQALLTRRSIRNYTSEPVSHETVTELLKAAMSAPTAANQCWHFVVIRERGILEAVTELHPHAEMLKTAPVAIAVVADPTQEKLKGRWPMDCSAATENILIAANAMGLGACWVGIYPVEERIEGLKKLLGAPDHVIPLCMVAIGHPNERKSPPSRFKSDRIHHEGW
ncbi:nitroreductase family protein [Thermodesulfobacteriota bacterium]